MDSSSSVRLSAAHSCVHCYLPAITPCCPVSNPYPIPSRPHLYLHPHLHPIHLTPIPTPILSHPLLLPIPAPPSSHVHPSHHPHSISSPPSPHPIPISIPIPILIPTPILILFHLTPSSSPSPSPSYLILIPPLTLSGKGGRGWAGLPSHPAPFSIKQKLISRKWPKTCCPVQAHAVTSTSRHSGAEMGGKRDAMGSPPPGAWHRDPPSHPHHDVARIGTLWHCLAQHGWAQLSELATTLHGMAQLGTAQFGIARHGTARWGSDEHVTAQHSSSRTWHRYAPSWAGGTGPG